MKKIKPSYPKRREMLKMSFEPLSDDEFRKLVAGGLAIPCQSGNELFVAKWRDGPGLNPDAFLEMLHAQGSKLGIRRYKDDVNIRVIRGTPPAAQGRPARASRSAARVTAP